MSKPSKKLIQDLTDRTVAMADQQYGVYSVDPQAAPNASLNPPRNVGSVEPGAPSIADKVPVIPTASYDPIRSEGNWAPFRPVPEPIPGIVPGFVPQQPVMGEAQWGGTGTPITAGFLIDLGEYNAQIYGRDGVLQYEKMRRGDAQVWATLSALKSPLRSARWDVRPGVGPNEAGYAKAKEVADFVKDNLVGGLEFRTSTGGMTSQSWDEVMWNALLMLDFGCSVHEDVYTVDGNNLKLRALVPLLPITYYRWHTEAGGHTLIALEQYGYRGIEFINATVPAEKICRFTLHQEGSNFWGIALPLALDTPVPTPDGWTTMGEIQPGQRVFDEEGKVRYVTAKAPVRHNQRCFKLNFSSGTSIVADADHVWPTRTAVERDAKRPGQMRTTQEIYETQKQPGHTLNGLSDIQRSNHLIESSVPWTQKEHYITSVEEVAPRDTVCIMVDAPSHLFLAGRGCIPTHNTRPMYPHWYIKTQLYRIDAIAGERNGLGVPVITLAEGASAQDRQTAYNYVTKLSAHEMSGLVLPNGANFKIEGVSGQPRDLMKSIEHHNRMISTAAMAMFMTIGSAPHGSRATAATQHDFFLSSTQFLSNYVAERLRQTTIRRLVRLNFGEDAVIPKIQAMNLKMRDFEDVRQSLQQLAAQGLVVSDGPLRAYIRDQYELPEETDQDVMVTKKGETIEKDPVSAPGATPAHPQQNAPGQPQPHKPQLDQPEGNQEHIPQYKHPVTPAPKTSVKPVVNDVIQASDAPGESPQPTIYFVRHGETPDDVNPEDNLISSWSDVFLTAEGRSEAVRTAKELRGKGVAEIYSSDLPRTMQTAEAISKKIGVPVTPERGLRGWNVGAYTGLSANTKLKNGRTIAEQLAWLQDHPAIKPPGGDSWRETDARLNDAIRKCVQRAEMLRKPIVVVTHSRVINSLPTLSRGAIPQEVSEQKGVKLGRVAKAVKGSNDGKWSIQYNATRLSDLGYHSIADDMPIPIPNNRSGQPTQRSTPDTAVKGPPMDEKQEAHPGAVQPPSSPSLDGYAPIRSGKYKPVEDVTAQQAEQGARIISNGQTVEAGTSFKPSAAQERNVAPVPEELQPSGKQDTPLEPTPDPTPVVPETFDDEDDEPEVLADTVRKKMTHYEIAHGAERVRQLRQAYQSSFNRILQEITGPVKAKIIGSIARQAARQLQAKVAPAQMTFTLEPNLEKLLEDTLTEIHQQASEQATGEHK